MTLYIDTKPYLTWAIGEGDITDEAVTPCGVYRIYKHNGNINLRYEISKVNITRLGSFPQSEIEEARRIAQAHYESERAKRFVPYVPNKQEP